MEEVVAEQVRSDWKWLEWGLALFVQTMGLVRGGKEGRIGVGIGCSYGAVNACVTDDRPRSWKAWPQKCLPVRKRQQGTRRLPKFHESLPRNSWKGKEEDDGKRGEGTRRALGRKGRPGRNRESLEGP